MCLPTAIRPPFTAETAARKVKPAPGRLELPRPERVSLAYTEDSEWRNRGNEKWEFAPDGLMARRYASINEVPIEETDRRVTVSR